MFSSSSWLSVVVLCHLLGWCATLLPTSPSPLQPPRLLPSSAYTPTYSFLTNRNGQSFDVLSNSFRRSQDETPPKANQPNYEELVHGLLEQNATNGNPLYPAGLMSNLYLNSQPYFGVDSPTASFLIPQALMDQYSAYYFANQSLASVKAKQGTATIANAKLTNKNGLGRRIGELVTNSAEKASKAFKSISKFNLFNDIKPSRLFGSASPSPSPASPVSLDPSNPVAFPVPNPWFPYPGPIPQAAALSSWQPSVTPAPSSVFYQQPVFVRTPEMQNPSVATSLSTPVGPVSSLVNPSSLTGSSELFRNPKISENVGTGLLNSAASPSNSLVPIGGSTTVYHHFPGGETSRKSIQSNSGDLFTASQTQFGLRVNPPKDYNDFDGSLEEGDNLNDSDNDRGNGRDELKMNQQGNDRDQERNNANRDGDANNGGEANSAMDSNNNGGNDNWNNNWNGNDEPFGDSNNPLDNTDIFNHQPFPYGGTTGHRLRPLTSLNRDAHPHPHHHHHHHPRQQTYFPKGNSDVHFPHSDAPGRPRPTSALSDLEDTESWYNTFFGSSVSPMSRIRNIHLSNSPPFASLNSAPSTPMSMSISPDKFLPFPMYQDIPLPSRPQAYLPYAPRPYYNVYPGASSMYRPSVTPTSQSMLTSDSTVRSVPYVPAPYYMRYRPYYSAVPAYPASPQASYATPYGFRMATPYSLMSPSASQMYPMRVPFYGGAHTHSHHPSPYATMSPSMQPPIYRYRLATPEMMGSTRRMINITKRADIDGLARVETKKDSNKLLEHLLTKFVDRTKLSPAQPLPQPEAVKDDRLDQSNMATMYNAYQVLQDRLNQAPQMDLPLSPPSSHKSSSDYYYIGKDEQRNNATTTTTTYLPGGGDNGHLETTTVVVSTVRNPIVARSINTAKDYNSHRRMLEWREIQADKVDVDVDVDADADVTTTKPIRLQRSHSQWKPIVPNIH